MTKNDLDLLTVAWNKRLRLMAEGAKLRAEGDKLRAEGAKLWAEGAKLWAEGAKLWAEKIIEVCGNIKLEWRFRENDYDCILDVDGGITFKHK